MPSADVCHLGREGDHVYPNYRSFPFVHVIVQCSFEQLNVSISLFFCIVIFDSLLDSYSRKMSVFILSIMVNLLYLFKLKEVTICSTWCILLFHLMPGNGTREMFKSRIYAYNSTFTREKVFKIYRNHTRDCGWLILPICILQNLFLVFYHDFCGTKLLTWYGLVCRCSGVLQRISQCQIHQQLCFCMGFWVVGRIGVSIVLAPCA